MFESRHEPLASRKTFILRILYCTLSALLFISIVLLSGMLGYRFFEHMAWINAFTNSALTIADMGLIIPIETDAGKIFTGIYALLSGIIFFSVTAIIVSPIIHRIFHKFHLGPDWNDSTK